MKQSFISIKKLTKEPYSKILGYPKASLRQLHSRISELEKLKIKNRGPLPEADLKKIFKTMIRVCRKLQI